MNTAPQHGGISADLAADLFAADQEIKRLKEQARLNGEALQRVAQPQYGIGFNRLRGIARARLQDREGGVS